MNEINRLNVESHFTEFNRLVKSFFNDGVEDFDINGKEWKMPDFYDSIIDTLKSNWRYILPEYSKFKDGDLQILKLEFDSFFDHVIKTYFGENYTPSFAAGRYKLTSEEFKDLHRDEQELYIEWFNDASPYAYHKKHLFELLHSFKNQIDDITILNPLSTAIKIKPKSEPVTFKELFIEGVDYKKYIDALMLTKPNKLIDINWYFCGNGNVDKGVVASWILHLQRELKVIRPNYGRKVLWKVTNAEISDLNIRNDSTFYEASVKFTKKYLSQLEEIIQKMQQI